MSNNPYKLEVADKVYIVYSEENKQNIPQYICGYWEEIARISPRGIPQIRTDKFRSLRKENIGKIERYAEWSKKYKKNNSAIN